MEIAAFAPRPALETEEYDLAPSLFKMPEVFFSTRDAYDALEGKKFTHIKPAEDSESDVTLRKTILLAVVMFSVFAAMAVFVGVSNSQSYYDHSGDYVTPYFCKKEFCSPLYNEFLLTDEGYWINHTADIRIQNVQAGWRAALPVALLPPICLYVAYKIVVLGKALHHRLKTQAIARECHRHTLVKAALHGNAPINARTPAPPQFIPKLMALNVPLEQHYKALSFLQIKAIKVADPQLFSTLLSADSFSEAQCNYWHKLALMLPATPAALAIALVNAKNSSLFTAEPYFLEVLIQELEPAKLTDGVLRILADKLKTLNEKLSILPSAVLIEAIKRISQSKCSLEGALELHARENLPSGDEITLSFTDRQHMPSLQKCSKAMLARYSSTFRNLCTDIVDTPTNEHILLSDIDPEAFKAAIDYLLTGKLSWNKHNVVTLLQVVDHFDFAPLKRVLEADICHRLEELCQPDTTERLLLQCQGKAFPNLTKAIDVMLAGHLNWISEDPFDATEFLSFLPVAANYQLEASKAALFNMFQQNVLELCANDSLIQLLIDIANTNLEDSFRQDLFEQVAPLFEKNLPLLKALWDKALRSKATSLQEFIVDFGEEDPYTAIACWGTLPRLPHLETLSIKD